MTTSDKKITPNVAFGKALQRYRKKRGKTQADIAFTANLDRTYISLLELGKKSPTLDTMVVLCSALHITPSDLMLAMEKHLNAIDDKS